MTTKAPEATVSKDGGNLREDLTRQANLSPQIKAQGVSVLVLQESTVERLRHPLREGGDLVLVRDSHVPEEWQGRGLLEEGENRARNARARAGG